MKIVNFQGGLGNQMFIYTHYLYLRKLNPKEHIFGSYWSGSLREHNEFMLERIFDLKLPPHNKLTDIFSKFCSLMERLHLVSTEEGKYSIFYNGFWLDNKYCEEINPRKIFKFKNLPLKGANADIEKEILNSNSVSIHIRRGDYTNKENMKLFGIYSSPKYYKRAIELELSENPDCKFFVFSDDPDWVRKNMIIPNAVFVDSNTGNDSWIDMYLMSLCKDNIIANSTFSWWAATLNSNRNKRVYYPRKWFIWDNPDIFQNDWIAVDNL